MSERLTDEQLDILARFGGSDLRTACLELIERRTADAQRKPTLAEVRAKHGMPELDAEIRAENVESHLARVARAADALPIDEEMDRRVTAALNNGRTSRRLTMPALTAEEREALCEVLSLVGPNDPGMPGMVSPQALSVLAKLTRKGGE